MIRSRCTYFVGIPNTIVGGILLTLSDVFSFPESFLLISWVARYWKCSCAVVSPACTAALFKPIKSLGAFFALRYSNWAGGADLHTRAEIQKHTSCHDHLAAVAYKISIGRMDVNRKWTFCAIGQWFGWNLPVNRLCKRKET